MARRTYTDAEVDAGLACLALFGGNATRAERALAEAGNRIPSTTLSDWKESKPARYAEAQGRVVSQIQARHAANNEELADRLHGISHKVADRMENEVAAIPARDLPKAQQNLALAAAIHTDKSRALRDQPVAIVEYRSVDEIRRKWQARGLLLDEDSIDSTATELPSRTPQTPVDTEPPAG